MGERTAISWTDATWNPIRGCTRVSEGCRRCYAERVAARFSGPGMPYEGLAKMTPSGPRWTGEVKIVEEQMDLPLRWKRPRRVFVNSMSDLFHERLSIHDIECVWRIMLSAPRHQFQILTKRADRMREIVPCLYSRIFGGAWPEHVRIPSWIWLGVSTEDQETSDDRIPHLLSTPAAVRFVSAEPLLGPIDLRHLQHDGTYEVDALAGDHGVYRPLRGRSEARLTWVIAGSESGPGARPCDLDWVRQLRDDCAATGTAFHWKQHVVAGVKVHTPELDGRTWTQFPDEARDANLAAAGRVGE